MASTVHFTLIMSLTLIVKNVINTVINTLINLNTSSFVNRFVSICRRLKDRFKEVPLKAGERGFLLCLLLMLSIELNTLTILDSLSNNNNI